MEFKSRSAKRELDREVIAKLDREVVAKYERIYAELLEDVDRVAKILAAFGKHTNNSSQVRLKPSIAAPIIYDLRTYLHDRGKPTHQFDIIKAVGDARHKKYPTLLRPWGDVWKSLEYQARNNAEIVPCEKRGKDWIQVPLKQKPRAPRIVGGSEDTPDLYAKPDNLFWFKADVVTPRRRK